MAVWCQAVEYLLCQFGFALTAPFLNCRRYYQLLGVMEGHSATVTAVAYSYAANQIISGSTDAMIVAWDAETYQEHQGIRV